MFLFLKTIRTYFFWLIIFVFFTLICLPFAFLPKKIRYENRFYFFLTGLWCKLLVFFSFILVKTKGEDNLPKYPNNPAIIVMNHSSLLDIFCIEDLLGSYPHIWLSKGECGKIPLFNILLKRMHVLVKRESPRQAIRALYKIYDLAKDKTTHVLVFPEGKRYDDGKVHHFYSGFAVLAKKLKRPIIPIAICGANEILSKKSWLIDSRATDVKLIIGDPVFYDENKTDEEFVKKIHDWFAQKLEEN